MEDNELVAILAASSEKQINFLLNGSRDIKHNRTDWRRHIQAGNNIPQQPQPNYNYPPQQQYNNPPPQYGDIPDQIPNGIPQLLPVPGLPSGHPANQPPQFGANIEQLDSFNIPNYNQKQQEEQESLINMVIDLSKEIKSLKRSINKLIRDFEKVNLTQNTINTNDINDKS